MEKSYDDYTRKELIAEIQRLEKRKNYGLIWEEQEEEFDKDTIGKLPVLKELKNKAIQKNKNFPVNLLIEGDNYHSLSVLNYTHEKAIDVIYIDPPYNTGKEDFIFNDKYVDAEDSYRHSKWLSFMERRLKLAKSLLNNNGVIFISIDDNEMAQLKLLCDDIFFEKNFVQNFMWLHGKGKKDRWSRTLQQYILCYAKNKDKLPPWSIISYANYKFSNPDNDPRGSWFSGSISFSEQRSNKNHPNYYKIKSPSKIIWERQWQCSKEEMDEYLEQKKIFFGLSPKYDSVPRLKIFPDDVGEQIPPNIISDVESTRNAQRVLETIMGQKVFDYPKPVSLMKRLIQIAARKNSIILDFFAGTGTVGHAVLELNKEDGGNRQFILCTNNEDNNGSGLKIATDVCYPRIKKVIEGYKDSRGKKVSGLGGNFKYFKTAFVDATPTDANKKRLTDQSTEMLCIRENTFEKVLERKHFKIFKNSKKHTGIVFDQLVINDFKKAVKNIKGPIHTYIFSLEDEDFSFEFKDMDGRIIVSPIPEVILRVYRRIFGIKI